MPSITREDAGSLTTVQQPKGPPSTTTVKVPVKKGGKK